MQTARSTTLSLITLTVLLAGCSSSPGYFEPRQVASNSSVIYFYRPKADNPGMQPLRTSYPDVQIDGASVGLLKFNSHFAVDVTPGKHNVRITGLSKIADWQPRDIEQSVTVKGGEVKYLKLDVRYNLSEMNLGQPKASYLIYLTPMRGEDAVYEIRDTEPLN
ncbi:DUF2846 domain-containing protein [Pseudomonas turukhanskensis]|uniref:DUF2846 domain-containing protein n=1 Tax=Pseudomonas turukhanskensis TaxID=1806536 RepID=UPI0022F2BEC0|nr:DUF2846 domain-containing protein [Pseudomonas turukhanskensis]